jgi:hypothetical protein
VVYVRGSCGLGREHASSGWLMCSLTKAMSVALSVSPWSSALAEGRARCRKEGRQLRAGVPPSTTKPQCQAAPEKTPRVPAGSMQISTVCPNMCSLLVPIEESPVVYVWLAGAHVSSGHPAGCCGAGVVHGRRSLCACHGR